MNNDKLKKENLNLPDGWTRSIELRYLNYRISKAGHEIMIKFFQTIGEGTLEMDTWYGLNRIRAAVKDAGFILAKNKLTNKYLLYKNETVKKQSFIFNTELLDIKNDII